jgi:hypothetical protein
MRNKRNFRAVQFLVLSLVMVLALSACNFPLLAGSGTSTPEPGMETPMMDEPTAAATDGAPVGGGGSCLVGKWQVSDLSAYFNSLSNMLPEGSDASVTNTEVSGTATFEFRADGTGTFVADQFKQAYTMSFTSNGTTIDIPMSVLINGTAESGYTVEGDEITFHDQTSNNSVITIDIMGNTTEVDSELLGTPGSIKLYKYQCTDANTLMLDVVAADGALQPLTLNRIP